MSRRAGSTDGSSSRNHRPTPESSSLRVSLLKGNVGRQESSAKSQLPELSSKNLARHNRSHSSPKGTCHSHFSLRWPHPLAGPQISDDQTTDSGVTLDKYEVYNEVRLEVDASSTNGSDSGKSRTATQARHGHSRLVHSAVDDDALSEVSSSTIRPKSRTSSLPTSPLAPRAEEDAAQWQQPRQRAGSTSSSRDLQLVLAPKSGAIVPVQSQRARTSSISSQRDSAASVDGRRLESARSPLRIEAAPSTNPDAGALVPRQSRAVVATKEAVHEASPSSKAQSEQLRIEAPPPSNALVPRASRSVATTGEAQREVVRPSKGKGKSPAKAGSDLDSSDSDAVAKKRIQEDQERVKAGGRKKVTSIVSRSGVEVKVKQRRNGDIKVKSKSFIDVRVEVEER